MINNILTAGKLIFQALIQKIQLSKCIDKIKLNKLISTDKLTSLTIGLRTTVNRIESSFSLAYLTVLFGPNLSGF